jgi:hypothetical protein
MHSGDGMDEQQVWSLEARHLKTEMRGVRGMQNLNFQSKVQCATRKLPQCTRRDARTCEELTSGLNIGRTAPIRGGG